MIIYSCYISCYFLNNHKYCVFYVYFILYLSVIINVSSILYLDTKNECILYQCTTFFLLSRPTMSAWRMHITEYLWDLWVNFNYMIKIQKQNSKILKYFHKTA